MRKYVGHTRYPVATLIAELASGKTVVELADTHDIPVGHFCEALDEIATEAYPLATIRKDLSDGANVEKLAAKRAVSATYLANLLTQLMHEIDRQHGEI